MSEDIYKLLDLVEDIKKVDDMIKLHSSHPDKFMLSQYEAKKEKMMALLIDELISPSYRSTDSFLIIKLSLEKFYPKSYSYKPDEQKKKPDFSLLEKQLIS